MKFHLYLRPNVLELYIGKFFSAKFPLPHGLGVAHSARVQEVPGSNPNGNFDEKNCTVKYFNNDFLEPLGFLL